MAKLVANQQWDIEHIDLSFYIDYIVDKELETGGAFTIGGVTYPDHFSFTADDGADNLRLDFYGYGLTINSTGTITAGEVRAIGEVDLDTSAQLWFLDGIIVNAAGAYDAVVTETPDDDLAVLQSAFSGDDTINLSPFADVMSGYSGDDHIKGAGGDDILNGGFGSDTAYFDAAFEDCVITVDGGAIIVATPTEGTDRLTGFEMVSFAGDVRTVASLKDINEAPVAIPATASATEDGSIVTGQLEASDPDGDALTFSPVLTVGFAPGVAGLTINPDGSFTFDPSDPDFQSLAEGEVKELLAGYFVSDGSLSDSSTLTITITGMNDAPTIAPSTGTLVAFSGSSADFSVGATDIDGDTLSYSASGNEHGAVENGGEGEFTYTPDPGFLGVDTVTVTVADGHGGTAQQTWVITVNPPVANGWRLFTSDGFAGEIGGSGQVFGTTGFQDIAVLDAAGTIAFDPSFNRGGDIVRLHGEASAWQGAQSGSAVILSDGDTFVQLPVGTVGTAIVFDDGVRLLRYDVAEASLKLGEQDLTGELGQITAPADGSPLPTGGDPAALARLFLGSGAEVTAGGKLALVGTSGHETVTVTKGTVEFDPSFNRGGDIVIFNQPATEFLASQSGSSVLLDSTQTDIRLPVGTSGATLSFADGDERVLLYDTGLASIVIGAQEIDLTPVALLAFG
ncbi:MAG: cadherin-like domain-containing protein [Novosphingobium sp.]|nr:cadherin-like domain-containing protein [Novosphingobium sp.]